MYNNLKYIATVVITTIVLSIVLTSCTSATSDTSALFEEINRLEKELETKETEIENLNSELETVKAQLEEAQEQEEDTKEEIIEEEQAKELSIPENYYCGDEISFYEASTGSPICSLIVHSIENFTEYDSEWEAPDAGMRYISIDVEVKNISKDVQSYHCWNYAIRDADNYVYDEFASGEKEPQLSSGDFSPGDIVRGWITIQLPEDIEIIEVLAEPCYCSPPAIINVEDPFF